MLLEKANIVKNRKLLASLLSAYDYLINTDFENSYHISSDLMFRVMECYDYIADELIIVGAFEQYAKTMLLENDIVIHVINGPEVLKKEQRTHPIDFVSCNNNESITICENSIEISTIVNNEPYYKLINMNASELDCIRKMIKMRNRVHLNTIGMIDINMKVIDFVDSLYKRLLEKESEKEKLVYK